MSGSYLSHADLVRAYLHGANLSGADLSKSDLSGADLSSSNLSGADLSSSNLSGADLNSSNLNGTDLSGSDLRGVDLSSANLSRTNLSYALVGRTTFGNLDLRTIKGLETLKHSGPSTIGTDTIVRSKGHIPEVFLRGTGLDDVSISYVLSLVGKSIEYASCFISYAHQDGTLTKRLHNDLQNQGVRCWFAPHDLRPGTPIVRGIEEAIYVHEKLLLILSKDAVMSNWVQQEVEAALYKEATTGQEILFPIRLDNTILESNTLWAKRLRQRHIGDFTGWQDDDAYQEAFTALLRHLTVKPFATKSP
jgi:uncharacterized protein YjbI with pentapeptide repeats